MTTLYIAGPMTGYADFNRPAFFLAEEGLRSAGFEVLNPARHEQDAGRAWADYMRVDLADVLRADGVAVLPGWELSRGARLEVHVAHELSIPVLTVPVWRSRAERGAA